MKNIYFPVGNKGLQRWMKWSRRKNKFMTIVVPCFMHTKQWQWQLTTAISLGLAVLCNAPPVVHHDHHDDNDSCRPTGTKDEEGGENAI